MGCVSSVADNVVPFRRIAAEGPSASGLQTGHGGGSRRRSDQRALMDTVYASGALCVAAGDRETKLTASRLLVYGFLAIDEVSADGALRRLRSSEAIRAAGERPWRLSRPAYAAGLAVTIPASDGFLFETLGLPA